MQLGGQSTVGSQWAHIHWEICLSCTISVNMSRKRRGAQSSASVVHLGVKLPLSPALPGASRNKDEKSKHPEHPLGTKRDHSTASGCTIRPARLQRGGFLAKPGR